MIKLTGGQRIDLLGVRKEDLPAVWADLDMPSGYAYGKSFRTVKTCVGSDFCRYGVGDSTALGIAIEERYQGLASPAKMKLAVTGCPRNCAEALCKDLGVVAVDGGRWEIYVGGAAGAHVRKGDLLATVDDPRDRDHADRPVPAVLPGERQLARAHLQVRAAGRNRARSARSWSTTPTGSPQARTRACRSPSTPTAIHGRTAANPRSVGQFRTSLPLLPLPMVPVR